MPLRVHCGVVGRIDFVRIVAAAIQAPDVVVGQVAHHLERLRIFAEEMLARIGATEGLAGLVFAVDGFHHQLAQQTLAVVREQRIPVTAPDHLEHVPVGAAEHAFEFLDDLAVATHRAIQTLQIAIYHKDQIVQFFAAGQRDRAERFGFVGFAVADEAPDLAVGLGNQAAMFQVLHEMRLVDRLQRTQTHRHRRHLPVIRHQPRMRIRTQAAAMAGHFHAEQVELIFADAAFEKRARIDARAGMALMENQITRMRLARRAPEMIEADIVECRAGGEAGDMTAEFARLAVGTNNHRHRIPANQATDAPFHVRIAGHLGFELRRNRVDVFRSRRKRQVPTGAARGIDHAFEQEMRAIGTVGGDDRIEGLTPFPGFDRIQILIENVVELVHAIPPLRPLCQSLILRLVCVEFTGARPRRRFLQSPSHCQEMPG